MYNLTVTAYSLNVRRSATVNSQAFAWIHQGQKYTSSKTQNGWYYIDSLKGWVSGKYVRVEKAPTPPKPANNTPPPSPPKETPKNTTTTNTETKTEVVKDKTPTSYVIDTKRSAGAKMDTFSPNITSSTGHIEVDNPSINIGTPNGKALVGLPVNPNTGDFYQSGDGFVNFSEYKFNRNIGGDHANKISGMANALNVARKQLSVYGPNDEKTLFDRFNRFRVGTPGVELGKSFPYIFFTRPDLDLLNSNGSKLKPEIDDVHHTLAYLFNNNPDIFKSLHSKYGSDHKFNVYLSNMARSFEPSDEVIRTVETGETYTGWKTVYGRNTNESNSAGQFNIQYRDSRNLDIMKMHKVWIDYMNGVYRGAIEVDRNTIHKKILNYGCSLYYIVCAEDGETILYWAKYYGVFPINVPTSTLGWAAGSPIKLPEYSISYMYAMRDFYDPIILSEFNRLSSGAKNYKKIYNQRLAMSSSSWSGSPYIDTVKDSNGRSVFKLRFRM